MTPGQENLYRTLRSQAWQRAKGEILSMLHTYWGRDQQECFEELNKALWSFINRMENELDIMG